MMLSTIPIRTLSLALGILLTYALIRSSFRAPALQSPDLLQYQNVQTTRPESPESPPLPPSPPSTPSKPATHSSSLDRSIDDVHNETLGFEKIYMVSLPARTDKQDTFAMQAALSGILYTQMDGVIGEEVPAKALPHTMDQRPSVIGCWRAHLNVLQKIVRDRVSTAFIFEDDADWDVALKYQLVQFARGSRYILRHPGDQTPWSPYGDDWDLLWLGHCGTWVHPDDKLRYFVIPEDPTVEPPQHRQNVDMPDMSHWESGPNGDNRTRIVFKSEGGVCTAGYAISQRGARKVLYWMSMQPFNSQYDWGLAGLCKNRQYDFNCVGVFPQLVGVSRPTANTSKWSDIGYGDEETRGVEEANSQHLVYSTRLNMKNLLDGRTVFGSQYAADSPPMDIKDIARAEGHVEVLTAADFAAPPSESSEVAEEE